MREIGMKEKNKERNIGTKKQRNSMRERRMKANQGVKEEGLREII